MHRGILIQRKVLQKWFSSSKSSIFEPQSVYFPSVVLDNRSTFSSFACTKSYEIVQRQYLKGIKFDICSKFCTKSNADGSQTGSSDSENSDSETTQKKRRRKKKDFNFDALGTWDNRIDLPIMMEQSIKMGVPVPLIVASDVGCSSIVGKRTYQEDRYVVVGLPDSILCAAVFDGHGGSECSEFCHKNLENVLKQQLSVQKDLEAVLHHSFLQLHSEYAEWAVENSAGLRCGTTATVCLLRNGVELAVGHVGDSRAILFRSGSPRELAHDHCPSLKSEKVRILQSGGRVTVDNIGRYMVNDKLNMSRSIGDLHLKQYGVIALPDTRTLRVKHGKDAFLLLITDGVNFVLRNEEACDIISQSEDPYKAAHLLTEQALSMASEDNVTALVVPFGSWGKFTKSASMFFSFGIGRDMNKSSRFG